MIYLHSDFNNQNILPLNYNKAKDMEKYAKDERINYIEKLTKLLGIPAEFYRDWTHNSVDVEEDSLVYRKGSIDLKKTERIGALALEPFYGFLLYAGNFSDYMFSVQHGVGRKESKGQLLKKFRKIKHGIARGYYVEFGTQHPDEIERLSRQVYNFFDEFISNYYLEYSTIGFCSPKLVVTTKKT